MELQTKSAAEQFADDFLLIMENDHASYERLQGWKSLETYEFAEYIKETYEEDMTAIIGEKDTANHWLARQILLYWGIEPFILIAKRIKEAY
jgi:hypothetical protein